MTVKKVAIGQKLGMSRIYDDKGVVTPVTLIKVYDACASDVKSYEDKDFDHLTLSYGQDKKTEKRINNPVLGYYKKKGLNAYDNMKTFQVAKDCGVEQGAIIGINQFGNDDYVDVVGISKGKGLAGAMKKYHFRGQMSQHGDSLSHRSLGGTGSRRREGRVFKGKKMAGHMGSEQVTVKNLLIVAIEPEDNIICVKGAIPGAKGGDVIIKSSNK